ncbi:MAG TPA: ABC transporter substrate-binding protein [Bacillota bacterium]|nr:ABC transporter substrate-binding protein [Bacillota bacterium]
MKINRTLVLILCVCMVVICFTGCSGSGNAGTSSTVPDTTENKDGVVVEDANTVYKKSITIAPALDFTSMDVQNDSGGTAKSVYMLVFNTLIEYDTTDNKYIPGLAESWKQISDTTWEFKLRQGVKFHDGSEFSAEDVKFTIDRGLQKNASKSKFSTIKEVTVIDDYTVQLNLKTPDMDLVYKLCEPNTVIICKNAFDTLEESKANQVGTGPYMYKEWVQGDYLSLTRFNDYWDGARKTEEIIIRSIPEASSRLIALQTGEIDVCVDPPVIDLHYVSEDKNLKLWQIPSSLIRHITLNLKVKPFDNHLVRQAVAHAIDREAILALVYEGNATPHYNVMHPISEFYTDVDYYEFDQAKSKALLAEAGYPDGFKTEIYSGPSAVQKAVANVVQAQLREVGIEAEVKSLEIATFNAGVAPGGTFPIQVDGWGGHTIGPDNALRTEHHSNGSVNRSNIKDEAVDKLIDDAISENDNEKRKELYAEAQQHIVSNSYWIPLAIEQINVGIKSTVKGFEVPHGLFHHWRNLYIIEE